ncbi:MAG: PAS domain S-box protein [Polyangiaceae bacterium]|nr:PAS domain S-box protein [Polyangiaceae bacterium]MCW5791735.1 PAS domain S-box protein [Polyangiaceae bacterium]
MAPRDDTTAPGTVSFLIELSEAASRALPAALAARAERPLGSKADVVLTDAGLERRAELRRAHPGAWQVYLAQGEPTDEERGDVDDVWYLDAHLERRAEAIGRLIAARAEATWYRELLESSHVGFFRASAERLRFANPALQEVLEHDDLSELIGESITRWYADPHECEQLLEHIDAQGSVVGAEITVVTRAGRHRRLSLSAVRHGGITAGLVADLTQVQRVEADLRASEELVSRLLDAVPGGVIFVGLDGSIGMGNAEAQRVLGLGSDELTACFVSDLANRVLREDGSRLPPEDYPITAAIRSGAFQPAQVLGIERAPGDVTWVAFTAVPILDPNSRETSGALGTFLDVSTMREAEEQVRRSESRYRELVQRSPDPIVILVAGEVAFANQAAMELVGATTEEQVLGRVVYDLFEPTRHAVLTERARRLMAGESIPLFEERLLRLDGTDAFVECAATTINFEGTPALFVTSRDVTARRETETKLRRYDAQMQHTQKLESLGILAGGIAHDFNNLLVAIVGNADLARLRLSDTSPALECLDRIQAAAQRATDLTNQMLAYSGKSRFIVTDVDLSSLVLEMSDLLGTVVSKQARLHRDLSLNLPTVEADPAQLGQVVMNLITNASDSLGDQPGDVYMSTRLVDVDRGFLQQTYLDEGLPEGRYVCLEVRDTGCGMDEATRSRIFDPFFTTKATGRGLGLAATLGIVRGHRGAVRIDTEPGAGTLFRIYLPCSDSPSSHNRLATSAPPDALENTGILIADDEALSLDVTREQLARLGLRVLTAVNGQEALELLERSEARVAVCLLDVGMRDVNGLEVVGRILERHPELRVVLTSGYTVDELRERVAARGAFSQISGFLQKPYTREALKRAVIRALERS